MKKQIMNKHKDGRKSTQIIIEEKDSFTMITLPNGTIIHIFQYGENNKKDSISIFQNNNTDSEITFFPQENKDGTRNDNVRHLKNWNEEETK